MGEIVDVILISLAATAAIAAAGVFLAIIITVLFSNDWSDEN